MEKFELTYYFEKENGEKEIRKVKGTREQLLPLIWKLDEKNFISCNKCKETE